MTGEGRGVSGVGDRPRAGGGSQRRVAGRQAARRGPAIDRCGNIGEIVIDRQTARFDDGADLVEPAVLVPAAPLIKPGVGDEQRQRDRPLGAHGAHRGSPACGPGAYEPPWRLSTRYGRWNGRRGPRTARGPLW